MATTQGYIKLHRQFTEWQHYGDSHTAMLFIHLLLTAAIKDKRVWGHPIKRGQVYTSRERLAEALNISESTVKRSLIKLRESGEITAKGDRRGTLITIVNYGKYQASDTPSASTPPPIPLSGFEQ